MLGEMLCCALCFPPSTFSQPLCARKTEVHLRAVHLWSDRVAIYDTSKRLDLGLQEDCVLN